MNLRSATWWATASGLILLAGCYYPVRDKIDAAVCDIAKRPFDLKRLEAADQAPIMPSAPDDQLTQTAYHPEEDAFAQVPQLDKRPGKPGDSFNPLSEQEKRGLAPLQVPPDLLPSGPVRKLVLPEFKPENAAKRREILRREFQPLRPPGPDYEGAPGPYGHPLTLAELQQLAMSSSPLIKQAVAAVEVARGTAYQVGLWPNPIMGYEVDTFGTTGGAGYAGGYIDQLIKTAGKLQLSRAVAAMDLRNAEVALRRAQMDLATSVRTYYFKLLVARENMRINRIMVAFTNAVYEHQAGQARGDFLVAGYEPMFLRALSTTARTSLVQARYSYITAWKQLSATLGLSGMPLTQVEGRVDMPVPVFDLDKLKTHVLRNHTDVLTAENNVQEARFTLMLAQVQPIPDVDVRFLVQKDYTGPPNAVAPSIAVSVPMPIWNRNQGGIAAAQAALVQAGEQPLHVRNNLFQRLVEAYGQYRTSLENLALFRDHVLPDLVRVYNGIYERYQKESTPVPLAPPGGVGLPPAIPMNTPGLNDVVVAQQTLAASVANYITNLGSMWQAVVDVTDLVQTDNMFRMGQEVLPREAMGPVPKLELAPLRPSHPCSPLPDPRLRDGDGTWPEAVPSKNNYPMPLADSQVRKPQSSPPAVVVGQVGQPAVPPATPNPRPVPPATLPDIGTAPRALTPRRFSETPPRVDPQLLEPPPSTSGKPGG